MSESIASQERKTQALVGGSSPIKPWSVEQDADALMDDLFSDFDRLLEGGTQLPRETVQFESSPLPSVVMPEIAAPLSLTSETSPAREVSPAASVAELEKEQVRPQPAIAQSKGTRQRKRGSMQHWDKILFGVACLALLGAIAWLVARGKLNFKPNFWQSFLNAGVKQSPSSEIAALSESDAQFINYMLRSLDLIDSKAASSPQAANSAQSALPPAPGTNAASGSVPQVIERVYIPIYPAVPGTAGGLLPSPSLSPSPATSSPNSSTRSAPAATPKTNDNNTRSAAPAAKPTSPQAAAPAPQTTAPRAAASSAAKPPSQPSPSAPAPAAAPAPQTTASLPPAPEPPLGKYSLVGLIVGSDGNSAALFNLNGVTQRVRAGEAVGDSGWTLYSAGNQSAIVRRNGEVREIYVGQKF